VLFIMSKGNLLKFILGSAEKGLLTWYFLCQYGKSMLNNRLLLLHFRFFTSLGVLTLIIPSVYSVLLDSEQNYIPSSSSSQVRSESNTQRQNLFAPDDSLKGSGQSDLRTKEGYYITVKSSTCQRNDLDVFMRR